MKNPARENWTESATVCDRGLVRAENQDAHCDDPSAGLFVVADGMGGGQGGAEASALVAESFRAGVTAAGDLAARLGQVHAAIDAANASIRAFAQRAGYRQTGSTAAVLLLGDGMPGDALAVWVGDSRIYRIRDGAATPLTNDHTVANELFGRGLAVGYSRKLPYAHVLTRVLGVDARVHPDARRFRAERGDRFLVCSDGVHDMVSDARLGEIVAAAATPAEGVKALAEAIRAAGAVDNFTATLVFLRENAK